MGTYSFTIRVDIDDVAIGIVSRVMVAAVNALTIIRAVSTATGPNPGTHDVLFQIDAANVHEAERTAEVAAMAVHPLVADAYRFDLVPI